MTELRDPAVAPNLSSAPMGEHASDAPKHASDAPTLAAEEFEGNDPPTIVDASKAAQVTPQALTRPVLGPALWIASTTLWSYVISGQFVLRSGMPEVLGVGLVVGVLVSTAYLACGRSLELLPARGQEARKARFVKPTWIGVALAAGVLLLTSLVFSRASDGVTMLFLFVLTLVGVVFGKRFTGRPQQRLRGARRALGVGLWIAAVVLSLVVILSAVN